jgi:uncharacterized protein with GYD domain
MAAYIMLGTFTEQGIRNVKDTTKRAEAFITLAKSMGVSVKSIHWTLGEYDIVSLFEAPDDMAVTALGLALGKSGNVRTQTLKAFSQAEMDTILSRVT